jgi:hypothetical protein
MLCTEFLLGTSGNFLCSMSFLQSRIGLLLDAHQPLMSVYRVVGMLKAKIVSLNQSYCIIHILLPYVLKYELYAV